MGREGNAILGTLWGSFRNAALYWETLKSMSNKCLIEGEETKH